MGSDFLTKDRTWTSCVREHVVLTTGATRKVIAFRFNSLIFLGVAPMSGGGGRGGVTSGGCGVGH